MMKRIFLILMCCAFLLCGCASDTQTMGVVYATKGDEYFAEENYEEAMAYYKKAMEEDPQNVTYITNTAICYRKCGDLETAKSLYYEALDIDPNHAELNSSLGSLYILENDPEKAITFFEKAIEIDPTLSVAFGNGALAYAMVGDFETADEYLKRAVSLGYENGDVLKERIDELRKLEE